MRLPDPRIAGSLAFFGLSGFILSLVVGCATAPPDSASFSSDPSRSAPTTAVTPVEIDSVVIVPTQDGHEIRISARGSLVWTQYRDVEENLIVELPNTVLVAPIEELRADGIVARVEEEPRSGNQRPLTRLVVETQQPAEHTLSLENDILRLAMRAPVGTSVAAQSATASETSFRQESLQQEEVDRAQLVEPSGLDEPTPAPPISPQSPPAAEVAARGTAETPVQAPAPAGVPATRLEQVELAGSNGETVIAIRGDGEFRYSTFALDNPPRFVIDLEGVVNTSLQSTVPIGTGQVDQIRMAQFRPYPNPVSRVVFDLANDLVPNIERSGETLLVQFGSAAPGGQQLAQSELAEQLPESQPVSVELEPVETGSTQTEFSEPAPADVAVAETGVSEEPLQIRPVAEVPTPVSRPADVSLFEAQPVTIERPNETETTGSEFGVRQVGPEKEYYGEPISLSLKDADVTEVLRAIARISNLNIVIQPGVSGPVTVELESVPWDQALEQILKINGLGQQLEGNILRIAPVSQLSNEAQAQQQLEAAKALSIPLRTIIKRISYANAGQIATILRTGQGGSGRGAGAGIMSQRGSISIDSRTNTLIIQELPAYLDTVIQIIENLDIPEKQVMIEARIVETTRNFSRTLGIQWAFNGIADPAHGNTTGLTFPNNATVDGGVQLLTGGANGFLNIGLGNVLNSFELDVTLNAAENDGLINVISAPKVATLNNNNASIQTGLQIPIQTVSNNTVSVQFVNATLQLNVTPQVTAEGTILLDINVQKREPQLAFAVAGATNAPIATREARTRVFVRDGGTAVIGGIYTVSNNEGVDRVPGLANIPVLGHLFRNRNRSNSNEELLIFITPRVIQL